ncbi:hypothetical protein ID866_10715 [Astraeus odoratus]|nr:hypothetical protein ID866_10715 [Astraeus odoratus]
MATAIAKEGACVQCGWNYQLCWRSVSQIVVLCHQPRKDPNDFGAYLVANPQPRDRLGNWKNISK